MSKSPDTWSVNPSEVVEFIEDKIYEKGYDLNDVMDNRPAISKTELEEFFNGN